MSSELLDTVYELKGKVEDMQKRLEGLKTQSKVWGSEANVEGWQEGSESPFSVNRDGFDAFLNRSLTSPRTAVDQLIYNSDVWDSITMNNRFLRGGIDGQRVKALYNWTTDISFSVDSDVQASWTAGNIVFGNGRTSGNISAGNTGDVGSDTTYIYYDDVGSQTSLQTTTDAGDVSGVNRVLLAIFEPNDDATKLGILTVMRTTGLTVANLTADNISGDQLDVLAAKTGTLEVDESITMNAAGHIKGGQTGYDTGTGYWLGYDSTAYKFSIGDSTGDKLTWDGSDLSITGSITVSGGDAFSKTSDDLDDIEDGTSYGKVKNTQISEGEIILSAVSGDLDDVSDGSTYKKTTANEKTGAGRAYSGLDSSNRLTTAAVPEAALGSPGSSGLYLGSDYLGYYDGSGWKSYIDNSGNFKFEGDGSNYIEWNGTNLSVEGTVVATGGEVGGWTINSSSLESGNVHLFTSDSGRIEAGGPSNRAGLCGTGSGSDAIALWAGGLHANRTSAPFRVTRGGAVTATSATIKSSASGKRVEINSDALKVYDSSNLKANLDGDSLDFYGDRSRINFNSGKTAYLEDSGFTGGHVTFYGGARLEIGANGKYLRWGQTGYENGIRVDANLYMTTALNMQGNDIDNAGDVELDSLTKDVSGSIGVNSDFDMEGNDITDIGDLIYDATAISYIKYRGNSAELWIYDIDNSDLDMKVAKNEIRFYENVSAEGKTLKVFNTIRSSGQGFHVVNYGSNPSLPQDGDVYYNTAANVARMYGNGSWHDLW